MKVESNKFTEAEFGQYLILVEHWVSSVPAGGQTFTMGPWSTEAAASHRIPDQLAIEMEVLGFPFSHFYCYFLKNTLIFFFLDNNYAELI